MKIAVITAIFGGMEAPKPFVAQSIECDRIVITEENTPVPLPNLPPRLRAKYFKLQAHRIWPEYDFFVWIDGNIEVKSSDFVAVMVEVAKNRGIAIQRHHERQTIKEEIEFILSSENPYLKVRYGAQPLQAEYEYYLRSGMPENALLYSCNIFAYCHSETWFFNQWWNLVLCWSWFDQSAFSFLAHQNFGVTPVELGPMFDNQYFTLHPHDKWQQ